MWRSTVAIGVMVLMTVGVKTVGAEEPPAVAPGSPEHTECTFRPFVGQVVEVIDTNILRVALASEVIHMRHEYGVGMRTTGRHDEPVGTRNVRIAGVAACDQISGCLRSREVVKAILANRRLHFEIPTWLWTSEGKEPMASIVLDEAGKVSINDELRKRGWATEMIEEGCLLKRLSVVAASSRPEKP